MKVLVVSAEVAPYAKSGGLGDVAGSLPNALAALGTDIRIAMPRYASIKQELLKDAEKTVEFDVSMGWRTQHCEIYTGHNEYNVPVYFIKNDYFFYRDWMYGYGDDNERFAFFCKAVIEMLPLLDFIPDVIHCNDWQTGPVCLLLKERYAGLLRLSGIKTVFTIHNLQYQGNFPKETEELLEVPSHCYGNGDLEFYGRLSYMKAGLVYADMLSTVSETYSREIQTPEYAYGMDGVLRSRSNVLHGIMNGLDYIQNDPKTDKRLFENYSPDNMGGKAINKTMLQKALGLQESDAPIIGMVSRLADQKGFDILAAVFDEIMCDDVQFILLGTGEQRYEDMFRYFAQKYTDKVRAMITFDDLLAQHIYSGSDMFLMPSLFEPCGLGQLIALRYGCVPVVRKTGGLADSIRHFDPKT
ncbi:MAG: glycogen synthase, partial [Firmicutes bacterium]|nr:glycogen synthase [Bacillota bacterium]